MIRKAFGQISNTDTRFGLHHILMDFNFLQLAKIDHNTTISPNHIIFGGRLEATFKRKALVLRKLNRLGDIRPGFREPNCDRANNSRHGIHRSHRRLHQ